MNPLGGRGGTVLTHISKYRRDTVLMRCGFNHVPDTEPPAEVPLSPIALGRKELKGASCSFSRKCPQMALMWRAWSQLLVLF